jgi:HSP20 family protein
MDDPEGELAIDVHETADSYIVRAPLAGVRREDLEITVTDELISIRGHRPEQLEHSNGWPLVNECYWGGFSRTYSFPTAINASSAQAKLTDGILTITIQKPHGGKPRMIPVS